MKKVIFLLAVCMICIQLSAQNVQFYSTVNFTQDGIEICLQDIYATPENYPFLVQAEVRHVPDAFKHEQDSFKFLTWRSILVDSSDEGLEKCFTILNADLGLQLDSTYEIDIFYATLSSNLIHKATFRYIFEGVTTSISESSQIIGTTSVYPNPANNQITITGLLLDEEVTLLSTTGQVVAKETAHAESVTFDVFNLPRGVYILHTSKGAKRILIE